MKVNTWINEYVVKCTVPAISTINKYLHTISIGVNDNTTAEAIMGFVFDCCIQHVKKQTGKDISKEDIDLEFVSLVNIRKPK